MASHSFCMEVEPARVTVPESLAASVVSAAAVVAAAVVAVVSALCAPQAAMDRARTPARAIAISFFIFVPPVFLFGDFAGFASFPADEFIIITRVLKKNRIFFDKLLKFLVIS